MFKDQNSMIVTIVAILLGGIGIGTLYFTAPVPEPVLPVETVPLAPAKIPDAGVTYANALPGAGSGAGTGAPGGFGAPGPGGFGGGGPNRGSFGSGPPPGLGGPPGGLSGGPGGGSGGRPANKPRPGSN